MRLRLMSFESTDGLGLPGLLYEPDEKTKRVALCLHGNGSSSVFYSGKSNVLGEELTKQGIAYFPFNNRGAHYVKSLDRNVKGEEERVKSGMAYELIEDCVKDIDGAIEFLKKEGFEEFYVLGFSTGANKICVYEYLKPENEIAQYVLLGGGDDTGIYYEELGKKAFDDLLAESRDMISEGRGEELVDADRIMGMLMSYQSLYDTINPDGLYNCFPFGEVIRGWGLSRKELFREFRAIRKPTLVMYGSEDIYCGGDAHRAVKILQDQVKECGEFTFEVMEGADHGFSGKEESLGKRVGRWLNGED